MTTKNTIMTDIYTEFSNTLSQALLKGAVISALGSRKIWDEKEKCVLTVSSASERLMKKALESGLDPESPVPMFVHTMVPGKRSINAEYDLGNERFPLMKILFEHQPNIKSWVIWFPDGEK